MGVQRLPALHIEVFLLVVCSAVLALGIWRQRFGAAEIVALLGALFVTKMVVSAVRHGSRPDATPR